jgi:uncharacterized protein
MYNINNLFIEIKEGKNEEVLKILDELGIDALDNYNRSALINAAFSNNIELAKALIARKAALDLQDKIGFSALHFAAQEAHSDMAKLLLENGANPDLVDRDGNTPARISIINWKAGKNMETLRALVRHNCDLTIENRAGRNALDLIPPAIREQLEIA